MNRFKLFSDDQTVIAVITFACAVIFMGCATMASGLLLLLASLHFVTLILEGLAVACAGVVIWAGALFYEHRFLKQAVG